MENISSIRLNNLSFSPEKLGDFIYHEGPLLSIFKDKNKLDEYYLYKWCDCDSVANRWLIFHVTTESLRAFLFKEISLRDLIFKNQFVFYLDLDNELEQIQCLISSTNEIPNSYLPSMKSFFKENSYTEFATSFKSSVTQTDVQQILSYLLSEVRQQNKEIKNLNSYFDFLLKKDRPEKKEFLDTKSIYRDFSIEPTLN